MLPNHAFNRTRRYVAFCLSTSVAAPVSLDPLGHATSQRSEVNSRAQSHALARTPSKPVP
jgi:hypothetical protein